jgi:pimeloyl-ACP methyl ester carboxylesterase
VTAAAEPIYQARQESRSRWVMVRGIQYHVRTWGRAQDVTPERPALVLLHGWMDVAASFQFVVDELMALDATPRYIIAPDWRGFGWTHAGTTDSYWFADYLGDLDQLLASPELGLKAGVAIDLVGHSMGANVAMSYAGVRAERIRSLVNLEGFGMPQSTPDQAPLRLRQWLDELQQPATMHSYREVSSVAARLSKNNPRLTAPRAAWLASHWSRRDEDGRWHILGDAAHKRISPLLYRKDEVLACWQAITAPVLWVDGAASTIPASWGERYPAGELEQRLAVIARLRRERLPHSGHMLHHDQPEALAALLLDHLSEQPPAAA